MLADLITDELFAIFVVFLRIGSALMLMPGFAEPYIFPRSRLSFALILSFALAPPLAPFLPAQPAGELLLAQLMLQEILLGLFIGAATRLIFATLHIAGTTIAVQSGLATASVFDPSQSTQGTLPGNFLTTTAMVLLFVTDAYQWLIEGLAASYVSLPTGTPLAWGDMGGAMARLMQRAFDVGIQIAAPLLVVGLLTNFAMGILNRLMPTFQVFFIAMPLQILLAMATIMLSFAAGLAVFFNLLDVEYGTLTGGG